MAPVMRRAWGSILDLRETEIRGFQQLRDLRKVFWSSEVLGARLPGDLGREIGDEAARIFSSHVYSAIGFGKSVATALRRESVLSSWRAS
jgi:hypothetical protein